MEGAYLEKGIDVSHWQGNIDWKKVAESGIKHVCIKMSQGASYSDPKFLDNWRGATVAGMNVGCYHYYSSNATPEKQLENIKKNLSSVCFNSKKNTLVIDVELRGNENVTPEQLATNLYALLKLIMRDTYLNCVPMIYTSPRFWNNKLKWTAYDFSIFPLWVAHWYVDEPTLPNTWTEAGKSWTWWQYSSKGKVDGIPDNVVDLNWIKCEPAPQPICQIL